MSLPSVADLLSSAVVVSSPMRVRFRGVTTREAVLFHGPSGWGEFCAFPEYDDAEAAPWLAAAIEAAWGSWPAAAREAVPINATIPAISAGDVPAMVSRFHRVTTAKIKVADPGQSLADDVARVWAVREAMGPEAHLRVDANGGWTVAQAAEALDALAGIGLQYAEQPCRTVPELVELREIMDRRGIDVPIAADESIRRAEDPLVVARSGAASVAVLKVAPLGGVARTVQIAEQLRREFGMRTVISSALETSVGMAAGVAAAAALPELDLACGLGTVNLFTDEPGERRLIPHDGVIPPGRVPADAGALTTLAADDEQRDWWFDRVRRCHRLLEDA